MQSPENERRRLLSVAIGEATDRLAAPIDRIEVTRRHIACWSGARKVLMAYAYAQGGAIDPATGWLQVSPGAGAWQVTVIDGPMRAGRSLLRRIFAGVAGTKAV